eukprot:TRINITY_DN7818_c0_g1_i3.p1 TRINITY_DN7818_c0_g1~~TRINITY_DN7818_c0_g1_i3.p1  ORF type:complete len:411 (-),score=140.48 TRINITY_DN7818_c0_g1_i3:74-1306(-)
MCIRDRQAEQAKTRQLLEQDRQQAAALRDDMIEYNVMTEEMQGAHSKFTQVLEAHTALQERLAQLEAAGIDAQAPEAKVQESVALANQLHQQVSSKLSQLQEVVAQVSDIAEDAQTSANRALRGQGPSTPPELRPVSSGGLESKAEELSLKVNDLLNGHQTISGSVLQLQRQIRALLEKPKDTNEGLDKAKLERDKLETKLSLLWRSKADKDEVDRAISRAVESVVRRAPEEQHGTQGPLLATWSCLGCGQRHNGMSTHLEATAAHKVAGGKPMRADLLFGKLRAAGAAQGSSPRLAPPLAMSTSQHDTMSMMHPASKLSRRRSEHSRSTGPSGFSPRTHIPPRGVSSATQPLPPEKPAPQASPREASMGMRGSKKYSATGPDGGASGGFRMGQDPPAESLPAQQRLNSI